MFAKIYVITVLFQDRVDSSNSKVFTDRNLATRYFEALADRWKIEDFFREEGWDNVTSRNVTGMSCTINFAEHDDVNDNLKPTGYVVLSTDNLYVHLGKDGHLRALAERPEPMNPVAAHKLAIRWLECGYLPTVVGVFE